jgi:hypothetical protein
MVKLKHHVPVQAFQSDPITPEYQAEVDRATSSLQVRYEAAERRLAAAELRLQRARLKTVAASAKKSRRTAKLNEIKVAEELVELRREELQRIEAMMNAHPAASPNQGRKSHRPVPDLGRLV